MLCWEMLFTIVFIVSPSVQSIPNAIRAKGPDQTPLIALIAVYTTDGIVTRLATADFLNQGCILKKEVGDA